VFIGGTLVGLRSAWATLHGGRGRLAKAWTVLLSASLVVSLWVAFSFHLLHFGVQY
jgi:hypothetical protein